MMLVCWVVLSLQLTYLLLHLPTSSAYKRICQFKSNITYNRAKRGYWLKLLFRILKPY